MTSREPRRLGEWEASEPWAVRPLGEGLEQRARLWSRQLLRLGVKLPSSVVRDFGLLLAMPGERLELVAAPAGSDQLVRDYHELVREFSQCRVCLDSRASRPGDAMLVALLGRLLGRVSERVGAPGKDGERLLGRTLQELVAARLYLLTLADSLDGSSLRLVGMLGSQLPASALCSVDLLAALGAPETHAIVQFSLQILPSILEAKAKPAASSFAASGYAGLSRSGSVDSMVLSELAWDDAELTRRLLENEVHFYAREQGREETRRVHHLLIDASASMRGERATFARGLALASAKKLLLTGDQVIFRFFDAQLYEAHPCRGGDIPVAHLLSFSGERGRNPRRVFRELGVVLEVLSRRDARQQVVHLFTHAALYIPRDEVVRLRQHATLLGMFMLPSSGKLELDYLDLLEQHWVVDSIALEGGEQRSREARRILTELGARSDEADLGERS